MTNKEKMNKIKIEVLEKYRELVFDVDVSEEFEDFVIDLLPLEVDDFSEFKDSVLSNIIEKFANEVQKEISNLEK